jgi:hypothetical protein
MSLWVIRSFRLFRKKRRYGGDDGARTRDLRRDRPAF